LCILFARYVMRTIILFARAPQRGRVKTRLARDIGEDGALSLYVAMLRDSLEKATVLARLAGAEVVLAYTPPEAMLMAPQDGVPSLSELWSGPSWPQPEGDLGAKMHTAIEWAFGRGASAVTLLGADTPDMNIETLAVDFDRLQRQAEALDVVLEPARDGGFWALACSCALPRAAFELDWGQDATCAPLQENLRASGFRVSDGGAVGDDVDDLPALRRLTERLRDDPHAAPRTAFWLLQNGFL
jgi:rSAM/selenodomain-associated transferase 1